MKNFAAGTVSLFTLIVLGLSANVISITAPFYFAFSGYALATSIITLLVVVPMYALAPCQVHSFKL